MSIEWTAVPHVKGAEEVRLGQLLLRVGNNTSEIIHHRAAWIVEVAHADGGRYLNLALSFCDDVDAAKAAALAFARQWIAEQAAALGDGWIRCEDRLPEADGWYHVAACDYRDRYPRHALAHFAHDRFGLDGDDGEGDRIFAWRHPALPALPEKKP